jgi:hypothetical protein
MTPACWCGRWRHHNVRVIGNSCGKKCPGYRVCESPGPKCERFCQKLCHPGPCEPVVCVKTCMLVRFPHFRTGKSTVIHEYRGVQSPPRAVPRRPANRPTGPTVNPRPATSSNRATNRTARRPRSDVEVGAQAGRLDGEVDESHSSGFCPIFVGLAFLAGLETGLGYWIALHIRAWTSPLRYQIFTEHRRTAEFILGVLIGCIFLSLIKASVAGATFYGMRHVLMGRVRNPWDVYSYRRLITAGIVGLLTLVCLLDFPIA